MVSEIRLNDYGIGLGPPFTCEVANRDILTLERREDFVEVPAAELGKIDPADNGKRQTILVRAFWKGAVSFGLVHIPVSLYAATAKPEELRLRFLHRTCLAPVKYDKVCTACGKTLAPEEIVRGFPTETGEFVPVEEEELPIADEGHTLEILLFLNPREVDPVYFEHTYYLAPTAGGDRAYKLLHEAMRESGQAGLARFILRKHESLALLRVIDSRVLALQTMYYPAEVRDTSEIPIEDVQLKERERSLAHDLLASLRGSFEPEDYKDPRRDLWRELRERKSRELVTVGEKAVPDLLSALEESLAQYHRA